MFFKQPPEVGKLKHIIISAHGRAGANTGADIWKGGGLRQRQKNIRAFLKNVLIFFRKDKDVRAGKERTCHIRIRRIPCTPGSFAQNTYNRVLQNCCHCYHPTP